MKLKVTGRGNFDRVDGAGAERVRTGWRTYPPSTTFNPDDPVNYTGDENIRDGGHPGEQRKRQCQFFHFSYFDPGTEKYVTLNSEAGVLAVEGDALPAPSAGRAPPEPAKPPTAEKRPDDIVGLRYESDGRAVLRPALRAPRILAGRGRGGPGAARRRGIQNARRRPDAVVRQRVALRQEKEAVWRRLRSSGLGHAEFFDAAARLAQIETALATGRAVGSVDAAGGAFLGEIG